MTIKKKITDAANVAANAGFGKIGAKYWMDIRAVIEELKMLTIPLPNSNAEEY
jgi:hypothetical protein